MSSREHQKYLKMQSQIFHIETPVNLEWVNVSIFPSSVAMCMELKDTVEGEITQAKKD